MNERSVAPSHSDDSSRAPVDPNNARSEEDSGDELSDKVRRLQRLVDALTTENRILRRRLERAEHSQ